MQYNRGFKQITAGLIAILAAGAVPSAEVGIYVAAADGGKSVGNMAIVNTLTNAGIAADDFSSMSMDNLLRFRAVIIPNTPVLAQREDPRWRDNLRAYVAECGGAIIFCHDTVGAERSPFGQLPLFPEIVAPGSVERAATAQIKIVVPDALNADFDYLPGYQAGREAAHMYNDHFMFEQNGGTALLADIASEKIVAAAGMVGAGRVVFNGLFGGNPTGLASQLEGIDRELMLNTVKWCLAGKGLVITDPAKAAVAEWRPEITGMTAARSKIAMIGSAGYDIRNRVVPKIERSGLEVDFIPVHFLNIRDLSPDDYKLILFFAPLPWEEKNIPATTFEKIDQFIQAGGKAILFLQGAIGRKASSTCWRQRISPLPAKRSGTTRIICAPWNGRIQPTAIYCAPGKSPTIGSPRLSGRIRQGANRRLLARSQGRTPLAGHIQNRLRLHGQPEYLRGLPSVSGRRGDGAAGKRAGYLP